MAAVDQLKPVVTALNMVPAAEINISLFTHQVIDDVSVGGDTLSFGAAVKLDRPLTCTAVLEPFRHSQYAKSGSICPSHRRTGGPTK